MTANLSWDILLKNRKYIFIITGCFILAGLIAAYTIPPTYKVSSVISISPSYFQNSLMREFLSEVYDPTELRSQRQSIMSEALDKAFLDELSLATGEKIENETQAEAALRRDNLARSIEIFSLQSSDFQVSVKSRDREKALLLNQKIVENIGAVLKRKRVETLTGLRSAIATQLDAMVPNRNFAEVKDVTSADALKLHIADLQTQINDLSAKFSDQHPLLKQKEARLRSLTDSLNSFNGKAPVSEVVRVQLPESESPSKNVVYDDLVRKYSYLNVVLLSESGPKLPYFSVVKSAEYPLAALWPKKSLFLVWSALLGLFASMVFVLTRDLLAKKQEAPVVKQKPNEQTGLYNLDQVAFFEEQNKADAVKDKANELRQ